MDENKIALAILLVVFVVGVIGVISLYATTTTGDAPKGSQSVPQCRLGYRLSTNAQGNWECVPAPLQPMNREPLSRMQPLNRAAAARTASPK